MYNDKRQFLLDHLSGMTPEGLATKWGVSPQVVKSRLRWAEERGDMARVRDSMKVPSESTGDHLGDLPLTGGASNIDMPPTDTRPARPERTPEEVRALFGTLQDKYNLQRLLTSVRTRIAAHEAKIGRKDAAFRIAQEQWVRQERCRLLGLTLNDLRRMRGIRV